jgi:hypothetical protein
MTSFKPGEVYHYSYLWRHQHLAGEETGRKVRPATLIFKSARSPGELYLLAITTRMPPADRKGIEIPASERARCGLDRQCWIIVDEFNQTLETRIYDFGSIKPLGAFSPTFTRRVAQIFAASIRAGLVSRVIRS